MKKSFSSTLVLTGVFALVLGWYLVWEKNLRPAQEKKTNEAKELVQFEPDQIQEIVVERSKLPAPGSKEAKGEAVQYETLRVKRVAGKWALIEPIADSGDHSTIENLVSTLVSTKYEDIVKEGVEDWKPYGLDKPAMKITAIKDQNTQTTLWVGNDTPVGHSSYLRNAKSDTLYQTGKALKTAFERQVSEFREHKVLDWVRADVAEVEIHGTQGEVLAKRIAPAEDRWVLSRQDAPADDAEFNKTLNAILELRASDFAPFTPKDFGRFKLSKPHLTVELKKTGDGKKLLISFWRTKDKNYAKRGDRDTVFEVANEPIETLDRPASALIDKTVVRFNRFQTRRFRIEHLTALGGGKKESVELVKVGPDWTVAADTTTKVNTQKVDTFLTSLQDIHLADYIALPAKTPAVKIVLFEESVKDGKTTEKEAASLSFGALDSAFVAGSRTGLARAFKLKMSDFKTINLGKTDFAEAPKETKSDSKKEPAEKTEQKAQ